MKKLLLFGCLLATLDFFSCRSIEGRPREILIEPQEATAASMEGLDSVRLIATKDYRGGLFKKMFQGKGYRKAWQTPISMPVVYIDTAYGGLKPVERGGGNQTLSMDLEDSEGNIFTMRSVNKDPSGLTPEFIEKINLDNLVTDAISAQHPYGSLVASQLADAVGVLHTHPHLIYVPHQKALGKFDEAFGNRMYFMEYEPDGKGKWLGRDDVKKIVDTEKVQKMLVKHRDSAIDTLALLRARLLDIVMGDWDRHAKQWGWVVIEKEEDVYTYLPMATDRDNVFYNVGGVFPWFVTRPFVTHFLRPHRKRIDNFKGLLKPFDSYFLYQVPEALFVQAARDVQSSLTDEVIHSAFHVWPEEFVDIDAKKIKRRMFARRDKLVKHARKFHKLLEKRGPITEPIKGSEELHLRLPE